MLSNVSRTWVRRMLKTMRGVLPISDGTAVNVVIGGSAPTVPTSAATPNLDVKGFVYYVSTSLEKCRASRNAVQAINDITWTPVDFNTESLDIGAMHSTTVNPSRFTAPVNGIYVVKARTTFAVGTGVREGRLYRNGTFLEDYVEAEVHSNTYQYSLFCSADIVLNATDYVEFQVYQNSGGALNINGGYGDTWFHIHRIA